MRRAAMLAGLLALAGSAPVRADPAPARRTWEVNGIRLEPGQVERLASDMAVRTVEAVEKNVADIGLAPEQRDALLEIYRSVSLDVYDRVVEVVALDELDDDTKETRVRELVLDGQRASHARLETVLDARQLELYSAWETKQVDAFRSRRWDRRSRRRR